MTIENAFLGYLAIMLFCKLEDSYRGIENTRLAYTPVSQRTLTVRVCVYAPVSQRTLTESVLGRYKLTSSAMQVKGLLRGALPTGKPYLVRGLRVTSGAGM